MPQIPRHQKRRAGFEGAFQKAVVRLIRSHRKRHGGVNQQGRAGQVLQQGVDAGGLKTEFRAMEDLPVLGQDGRGHAQVHALGQGQCHQHSWGAARLQGSGDEHVGVVDHPHGQGT